MLIIVSDCQHCDEQQFQTLSCVHNTVFSVVKLDLFIRTLLLDRILALEKTTRTTRVHLVTSYLRTKDGWLLFECLYDLYIYIFFLNHNLI